MYRRHFLTLPAATSLRAAATPRFFSLTRRNNHHWLLSPSNQPFFAIAMNHIDSATLRYPQSLPIWLSKYRNSEQYWLQHGVAKDLRNWGFNAVGWTQEVVIRTPTIHRHSRMFAYEHYQWLNLPYHHLLPFADFHQWELETRNPNLFSKDWEEWCDYVARDHCTRMANDPKLIGYFYLDCPTWVHTRGKPPMFDPARLNSPAGRKELHALATRYYQVTHDAIRRYDKHHLIFGDRYEANAPIPEEVVTAAAPFVDVLSFQHFAAPDAVLANLAKWHALTGKPTLLADASVPGRARLPRPQWGQAYTDLLNKLRATPSCIGWHLCGAYLTNRARNFGLKDESDNPDTALIAAVTAANNDTHRWVAANAR